MTTWNAEQQTFKRANQKTINGAWLEIQSFIAIKEINRLTARHFSNVFSDLYLPTVLLSSGICFHNTSTQYFLWLLSGVHRVPSQFGLRPRQQPTEERKRRDCKRSILRNFTDALICCACVCVCLCAGLHRLQWLSGPQDGLHPSACCCSGESLWTPLASCC